MSSANFHSLSSQPRISGYSDYTHSGIKDLRNPSAGHAAPSDPQLGTWYEQAYSYYNAVMGGSERPPSQEAWQDFLNQMQWAADQLGYQSVGGSNWGEQPSAAPLSQPASQVPQSSPFGGMPGTMNNWVYNEEKTTLGFTGDATPSDIWSNDVNLNVAPLSATVTSQITTDTRLQPPEQVLKIVVTDPATGTNSVYFVHDFEDANVKINVPNSSQVTDSSRQVHVGRFRAQGDRPSRPESSVEGEAVGDNQWLYEGAVGQTIDFNPQADGDNQVHEVYANANISVRASDHVAVSQGMPGDEHGYTVVVNHRDGSSDTFLIHRGFKTNLNALPDYVTWGAGAEGAETGVPDSFSQDFTLGGGGDAGTDSHQTPVSGDSPTETASNGDRDWDGTSFDVYSRKDGKTNHVFARNDLTLHAASSREYWTVEFTDGHYVVKVYDDASDRTASHLKETFEIDNMADNIKFDIDPSHIDFLGGLGVASHPGEINSGSPEADKLHFLNADETHTDSETPHVSYTLDSLLAGIHRIGGDAEQQAQRLLIQIDLAIRSGDWSTVRSAISGIAANSGNNVMNTLVWSLASVLGEDNAKQFLKMLSPEVRQAMIQKALEETDHLNETLGGNYELYKSKTTADTVAFISSTIEASSPAPSADE